MCASIASSPLLQARLDKDTLGEHQSACKDADPGRMLSGKPPALKEQRVEVATKRIVGYQVNLLLTFVLDE